MKSSKIKNSSKVKKWPKGQQILQGQVSNLSFQIVNLCFNIIVDAEHTYYTVHFDKFGVDPCNIIQKLI